MQTYDVTRFNQEMRLRTRMFAVNIYKALTSIRLNDLNRIPVKQLIKSATSVAANFSSGQGEGLKLSSIPKSVLSLKSVMKA
jgi:four helix bundle protein